MADRPSVKGSLIAGTIEKARKLLEEGRLSRPALEARLSPEELALFDAPTSLSSWYDLDFYQRVAELMHDLEGGNPHEYFRGQGFARAQKLIDSGLYQQMEYLGRSEVAGTLDPKSRFEAYGRDLRRLVTLSGSILNFSRWSVARDPDHDDANFPLGTCRGSSALRDPGGAKRTIQPPLRFGQCSQRLFRSHQGI